MTDEQTKATIAALLEERRGYEIHGKKDRVKEVDEALTKIGYKAKPPSKRATRVTPTKRTKL